MFRSGASCGALRSLSTTAAARPTPLAFRAVRTPGLKSQLNTLTTVRRPLQPQLGLTALRTQPTLQLQMRRVTTTHDKPPYDKIDHKAEAELAKNKLPVTPETVSTNSTVHPVLGEVGGVEEKPRETEMLGGVKHDLSVIRDTFSLESVPREAYLIGLAGVLPYLATSLSTFYCAWEIQHNHATGAGFLISDKTAELLLHVLEPLQIGYGITIISFLGAIHWGLEFAKYGGVQGYRRYAIGVVATGLAWPTILLPVEAALTTQFLLFTFLYYNDSRATKRGWAPHWYAVYRFVLTFVVGSSIVVSLIGRGQINGHIERKKGPSDHIRQLRGVQEAEQENEEETRKKLLATGGDDEAEEEEEGEGDGEEKKDDGEEEKEEKKEK